MVKKLTVEQVEVINKALEKGKKPEDIANFFEVGVSSVRKVKNNFEEARRTASVSDMEIMVKAGKDDHFYRDRHGNPMSTEEKLKRCKKFMNNLRINGTGAQQEKLYMRYDDIEGWQVVS